MNQLRSDNMGAAGFGIDFNGQTFAMGKPLTACFVHVFVSGLCVEIFPVVDSNQPLSLNTIADGGCEGVRFQK